MTSASIELRPVHRLALHLKHHPRQLRVVNALMSVAFVTREDVDRLAEVSNGPDEIRKLRRAGLTVPCQRVRKQNPDGRAVHPGRYSLTQLDRQQIAEAIAVLKGGAV